MLALSIWTLSSNASPADASRAKTGIQIANLDRDVRPQDDMFNYANGTWLRDVPIPADRSRYGVDSILLEQSLVQQRELLDQAQGNADANARKAGLLFASFMDEARVERDGMAPVKAELERIASIKTLTDVSQIMGHFERIGVASPLEAYVQPDAKNSKRYALWLTQSGLGLPDRDYYANDAARFVDMRAKYRQHVAALLRLIGENAPDKQAADVLTLETSIAKIQWNVVDRRDPEKTYNPHTLDELRALTPAVDWGAYLAAAGVQSPWPTMIVRQPDYLKALSQLMRDTPLSVWKEYLRCRLLSDSAAYLSRAFVAEDFSFNEGVLHDTPRLSDRWKRACALVDRLMGDALGRLYVERYFPDSSKVRVDELVANLLAAYADSIEHLDWLSPATRAQALAKLKKIDVRVGYPALWRDYGALDISATDLLGNVFRAKAFETARQYSKLASPVDRNEWEMTAPTVDAAYNPGTNSIEFPAGVLQPPLYDAAVEDAYNYGSTGATIGHEISHAFDNRGSQYDGEGTLRDWWTAEDHARFKARTDKLVTEFDAFEPVKGFHVNGALTLPENIADLAGLEIAYKAYLSSLHGHPSPVIDGFTGTQRFFIGYAQSFMGKRRDALLIAQLKGNPHAPEKQRVNGIVAHMDSFYEAFSVDPRDKMYLPPSQRIVLW